MARLVIENTGMKSDLVFMSEVDRLIKTIVQYYGGHDDLRFLSKEDLSLEDVMTLLDVDFRLFSSPTSQRLGMNESSQMRTLKDLLSRTLEYALTGPPCAKHRELADRMNDGDVVISLNYDLLMDNAMFEADKGKDSCYHMNFNKVNIDGNWKEPVSRKSKVSLFKLHGSLNWVRCTLCGSLLLYRFRKQILTGWIPFNCPRCSSDESVAERVMVPPLQSKDYRDKDMTFLWIQTDRMLKAFKKIVCIGYSFPSADSDMRALMRRLRSRQPHPPEVDFVSPDSDANERMKTLLGIKRTNRFPNLSDYLSSPWE